MAFTEASQPTQANSLVSFLDTASKAINGLMDKPSKGNKRKVNHKKYLQKRLQRQVPASKPSKPPTTTSNSAPIKPSQQPPVGTAKPAQPPPAVPPFLSHNSWPQLPQYPTTTKPSSAAEPDLDFLLQQLTSTADIPPQPTVSRPCSDSSLYPVTTYSHQPPLASTLESQVLLGEQPYGSPYTPSNCSTDDLFDDPYSSPCSSVYSSPAACAAVSTVPASLVHNWSPPTSSVSMCVPATTAAYDWGSILGITAQAPSPSMVSCSDWISVSSSAIPSTVCPISMDQSMPTVPQLWDPIVFSDMPY